MTRWWRLLAGGLALSLLIWRRHAAQQRIADTPALELWKALLPPRTEEERRREAMGRR